jgi:hypothetical protein
MSCLRLRLFVGLLANGALVGCSSDVDDARSTPGADAAGGDADAVTDAADVVAGLQDVAFFDADQDFTVPDADIPHIALIGMEAPSRLARVVRHRASSVLMKPVRATGVFTALFLAFNEHALRQREVIERANLFKKAPAKIAFDTCFFLRSKQKALLKSTRPFSIQPKSSRKTANLRALPKRKDNVQAGTGLS